MVIHSRPTRVKHYACYIGWNKAFIYKYLKQPNTSNRV